LGVWALFLVSVFLNLCSQADGHGNMVFPMTWWDKNEAGWFFTDGVWNKMGCGVLDLPSDNEYSNTHPHDPDCMVMWFSNLVKIPGNASIPDEISQTELEECNHNHWNDFHSKNNPWNAPGTAPIYGSCGTLGANPLGCDNDGEGNFGDCCNEQCSGGFALGKNAEDYVWDNPPVTEWKAGSYQEVAWFVAANHAGGYAYRLCKIPDGGITELTEECFQNNHLEFAGQEQWVEYEADKATGHRTELKAQQTTEGTFPPGSMWRANQLLPSNEEGGSFDYARGHIIDNVKVPSNLVPGDYVLSFRWDCKCTPQVWTSCANIRIV